MMAVSKSLFSRRLRCFAFGAWRCTFTRIVTVKRCLGIAYIQLSKTYPLVFMGECPDTELVISKIYGMRGLELQTAVCAAA